MQVSERIGDRRLNDFAKGVSISFTPDVARHHQELAEPSVCMKHQLSERPERSRGYGRFSLGDPAGLELLFVEPDEPSSIGK